ncbi:MAG TPA: hypothetical protein VN660_13345 [Steroidobacteraceae bacterium]|nr:hypothetical protein [Steroidobacteraceae bacterium]
MNTEKIRPGDAAKALPVWAFSSDLPSSRRAGSVDAAGAMRPPDSLEYGCVDWYQYDPDSRAAATAQRKALEGN